jgi:hypothetical protein
MMMPIPKWASQVIGHAAPRCCYWKLRCDCPGSTTPTGIRISTGRGCGAVAFRNQSFQVRMVPTLSFNVCPRNGTGRLNVWA